MTFIKIRNVWVNITCILMVKRTTPSKGADGVSREYVVTISENAEDNPKFRKIWANQEECQDLLYYMAGSLDKPMQWDGIESSE